MTVVLEGDFGILLFCDKLRTDDAVDTVDAGIEVDRFNLGDFVAVVPVDAVFFSFEGDAAVSLVVDIEIAAPEIILLLLVTIAFGAKAAITELLFALVAEDVDAKNDIEEMDDADDCK